MDLLRQAAKIIQLHLLHTSSRLLLFSRLSKKLKEDFQSTHQLVFKRKTARESLVKLDIDILHKDGLQFHLAAPIQSKNRDRVTYCVTWVVNWVSAALGYIKLTSAYSRLEKLWVRFDQTLFFLCIWTLLFFASCSTVWIILGPGPSFPFSLSSSFPFHPCQSLFTPVGKGCSLENLLMETLTGRSGATFSLEPPSDIPLLGHRYNLNPQYQDCGPDKWSVARHRSRQTPHFLAKRSVLCLLIYLGRWFSEFPVLHE